MHAHHPSTPTAFIIDDDPLVRDSIVTLLDALGIAALPFAAPGAFHRHYRAQMPGCLVLDVRMPRQSGLELYEQLLREGKRLPAIFMTAHADVATAVAAMKTGASEFLEKPFKPQVLADRVRKALALDAHWRRQDVEFAELNERLQRLTAGERAVLAHIHAGHTNKAIAARIGISERAVEMRRSSMMRKLHVKSTAEIVNVSATHRVLADLRRSTAHRIDQ